MGSPHARTYCIRQILRGELLPRREPAPASLPIRAHGGRVHQRLFGRVIVRLTGERGRETW